MDPRHSRLAKLFEKYVIGKALSRKLVVAKPCKICQELKKRKVLCEHLPPKMRAELKPRDSVHLNLIGHIASL